MMQPFHQHGQIATVGAERILRQIFLQPQAHRETVRFVRDPFHIALCFFSQAPLCLIATGFWYTTRKVTQELR
jgi:hypothetical protein